MSERFEFTPLPKESPASASPSGQSRVGRGISFEFPPVYLKDDSVQADAEKRAWWKKSEELPIFDAATVVEREHRLRTEFVDIVGSLVLAEIVQPLEGRPLPRSLPRYGLCALRAEHYMDWSSYAGEGRQVIVPDGISTEYGLDGQPPFLDAAFAIGLTFDRNVIAVASAGIQARGELRI